MPDPSRSAPRNVLSDPDAATPPAIAHSTEAVVALLARACRDTCGEVGDDDKVEAARRMFTTAVLALQQLNPKTEAIVRRLAHARLRVVAREHPDALPLRDDPSDPWHAHFLLLASDITLATFVGRAIGRRKDNGQGCGADPELLARIMMPHD